MTYKYNYKIKKKKTIIKNKNFKKIKKIYRIKLNKKMKKSIIKPKL